jgi:uncharacterized protein (TIGR02391 family)
MRQRNDQCANNIVAFVQAALEPTQFKGKQNQYDYLRERLNQALLSTGLQVGPEGKFYTVEPAHIPSETEQRVAHLRAELKRRDAHADVLRYCLPEMLENGYMPVIIACIQRLAEKIEEKTGLHGVGAHLVEDAFAPEHGARMAFNTLQTEAEAAEHIAILNLMKGMLEAFPDPTASRLSCSFNEKDTLDLLGLISLLHRRLDLAVPTE